MARKIFISVLGSSQYRECTYIKDKFRSSSVRFVQEAMLEHYLQQQEWIKTDKAIILLTKGAEIANWNDNGHTDHNTGAAVECEGLKTRLDKMNLPFSVEVKSIPDGNNEQEIWGIFENIYEVLDEEDEIYFDITHGFRFLPMLVLTLAFYSKFLKRTKFVSVTYGNFEARDKVTNEAPIVDLISLPALLGWSYAAGQFVDSGNLRHMCELCDAELRPILRDKEKHNESTLLLNKYIRSLSAFIEELRLCRGCDIIEASSIHRIRENTPQKTFISPLNPIFRKINESLQPFSSSYDVSNTIHAARWCFDKGLYQQAATILQEGIVSFFAFRHGIPVEDEDLRGCVNQAFYVVVNNLERHTGNNVIDELLTDELLTDTTVANKFAHLTNLRNDYNHSGMRSKRAPQNSARLIAEIGKTLSFFEENVFGDHAQENGKRIVTDNIFINLSNHPSAEWSEDQRTAAMEYGEIVDIPFPVVDENADIELLKVLADEYLLKVQQLAQPYNAIVHIMGEQTFTHSLLLRLQRAGYKCVASTTKRIIEQEGEMKVVIFNFERFREYEIFA